MVLVRDRILFLKHWYKFSLIYFIESLKVFRKYFCSPHSMIKRFAKNILAVRIYFLFCSNALWNSNLITKIPGVFNFQTSVETSDMWISYKIFWIIVYIYIFIHTFNIYNENVRTIQLIGTYQHIISISTVIIFK